MKNLMKELGYKKYYVQGGDWGGLIAQFMAALFPDKIFGLHSNFCFTITPLAYLKTYLGGFFPSLVIDDKVRDKIYPMKEKLMYTLKETGYMHIQGTKPDTLGELLDITKTWRCVKFSILSTPYLKYEFTPNFALYQILSYVKSV